MEKLKKFYPTINSLRDVSIEQLLRHQDSFEDIIFRRCKYVVEENQRVLEACQDLNAGNFEDLLQKTWPGAYAASVRETDKGDIPSVIEAIAQGVVFTSLEYSAHCDSLAVLRPQLPKKEKAVAIFRALKYSNRPYDYNFDFLTDNALVCTELVYKAYEPGTESNGLKLPLENRLGHIIIPANSYAQLYTEEFNNPNPQLKLVMFLDGVEKENKVKT